MLGTYLFTTYNWQQHNQISCFTMKMLFITTNRIENEILSTKILASLLDNGMWTPTIKTVDALVSAPNNDYRTTGALMKNLTIKAIKKSVITVMAPNLGSC